MNRVRFRFFGTAAVLWLSFCGGAHAYNEGGHYYTVAALFDVLPPIGMSPDRLRELKLQAFCAELPDLGLELDAISQRIRVLESGSDWGWGSFGACMTTKSSHMVASQYYLHGLSGAPGPKLRAAAVEVIGKIDNDLVRIPPDRVQDRNNLLCARGFAIHLMGDSFAHVQLSSEKANSSLFTSTLMYDTGLGHARDRHDPDYMYGHAIPIDKWPRWLTDAGGTFAQSSLVPAVLQTHGDCNKGLEPCEEPARLRLQNLVTKKDQLLISDMQQMIATGNTGIGDMARATPCDQVVNHVYSNPRDRPQCAAAWNEYLSRAIPIFFQQAIDPTARSGASAGTSCSAWRCSGKKDYNKESPQSCQVEISDKLSHGLD